MITIANVVVGRRHLRLLLADTPSKWRRGLQGWLRPGGDLGEFAGMLFTMPAGSTLAFRLGDVPPPLLIATYDSDGDFAELGCLTDEEPLWKPTVPYTYVIEAPVNLANLLALSDLTQGINLRGPQ